MSAERRRRRREVRLEERAPEMCAGSPSQMYRTPGGG